MPAAFSSATATSGRTSNYQGRIAANGPAADIVHTDNPRVQEFLTSSGVSIDAALADRPGGPR